MATGKLKIPEPKIKRSPLKNALHALKDKRDLLFRKKFKTLDDTAELSDPVYHLLRCAATPDHQPSTCKCVCHTNEFENVVNLPEMNCPINVLFASKSQHRYGSMYNQKSPQTRLPTSMPTLCQSEDDVYLTERYSQLSTNSPKNAKLFFPSIITRRRLFSGYKKYHTHSPKNELAHGSNVVASLPSDMFSETPVRDKPKR
ncbi:unnamed protein product [Dicrocoelium dendriticum]|nr:unnamed protein product [Dicrocoelium dendriticum]